MRIRYKDDNLARLAKTEGFRGTWSKDIVRAYRKVINLVIQSSKSPDLYAFKSLRIEKLLGKMKGYHSLRLNDQYRLIVQFGQSDGSENLTVVRIEDYH